MGINYQSESEVYSEYEEREKEKARKERDALLDRKEKFERELLDKKLKSIDKLSESISNLASNLLNRVSSPIINIIVDKDTPIDELVNQINKSLNS